MNKIIITIDGPVASGKTTLANKLSKEIGFAILHTGLIYRAIAKQVIISKINSSSEIEVYNIAKQINFNSLNDTDLYQDNIAQTASIIAKHKLVRDYANQLQHNFTKQNPHSIIEGRDAGTVVFPDANLKIFITADTKIRAERRYKELQERGNKVIYDEILNDLIARDYQDSTREIAPLIKAEDSVVVDSSYLTSTQTLEKLVSVVNQRLKI